MKILVTGGAGFIGSHVQDKLLSLGHQVAVIDNLASGKKENINQKSIFFELDIVNSKALEKAVADFKPEAIFHLAAQNEVPYSMKHPYEDEKINIVGTMNLLEASVKNNVKKFIYANTGGAFYGDVDESKLPIEEDEPVVKPTSFYGVSKNCAEIYLKLYSNLYGIIGIPLRLSNVYGPRQDGNKEAGVVAIFTSKMIRGEKPIIFGDGSNTRDYIYVDDVVEANIKALEFNKTDYFNISTGIRTSTMEVYKLIKSELKSNIGPEFSKPRSGDTLHNSLSCKKAQNILNWNPKINLRKGIELTVLYYK